MLKNQNFVLFQIFENDEETMRIESTDGYVFHYEETNNTNLRRCQRAKFALGVKELNMVAGGSKTVVKMN